jgi:sugar phosphate isomerase/epimerase
VGILADRIVHVHCKDARYAPEPGKQWGQEVRLGDGQARVAEVIAKLREAGYSGPLVIEREGGDDRIGDVRHAIEFLRSALG